MKFPVSWKRVKPATPGTPTLGADSIPASKSGLALADNVLSSRIVSVNGWPLSRVALIASYDGNTATAALPCALYVWEDSLGFWVELAQSATTVAVGTPGTSPVVPAVPTFFDVMSLIDFPHVGPDLQQVQPGTATFLCIIGDPGAGAHNGVYTFALGSELTQKPF